jgi:hypothetical protein
MALLVENIQFDHLPGPEVTYLQQPPKISVSVVSQSDIISTSTGGEVGQH